MDSRRPPSQLKGDPQLTGPVFSMGDNGHPPDFVGEGFVPTSVNYTDADLVNVQAAGNWIRAGNVLSQGIMVPKEARAFFERTLGTAADGHKITVFDRHGRLTRDAAAEIGVLQDQTGIFRDKQIGRETFDALFDPNLRSPMSDAPNYVSINRDFANAFYQGKNATVHAGHDGAFDMHDKRVSTFRQGLETLQGSLKAILMDGQAPKLFGRNGALTEEQARHVRELLGSMLKKPGELTTADVKAFQQVLKEVGFRDGSHTVQVNGSIDATTAQGLMNFAMMNRSMNPLQDTQTILAQNTQKPAPQRGAGLTA